MHTSRSRGFTLIELMTLIFVIAVLLAIAVVVLQSRRTECGCTRRAQCQNNLRDIGLALINLPGVQEPLSQRGDVLR